MDEVACDHKDCERTGRPLLFMHYSRHLEFLDEHTWYLCAEHRDEHFAMERTKTLPPADWLLASPRPGVSG